MKIKMIASLIMATSLSSAAYADCFGNVYAMNAGRGHVGFMIDVQEDKQLTGVYNGDRALKESRALFSSSAMAYDKNTNRIYYVSTPRPDDYHVDGLDDETVAKEFSNLDFHASRVKNNQLAYFDPETNQHTIVAEVPNVFRMAFNPATGTLFASDNRKVFTIDPVDGSTTAVGNFETNMVAGGFTNWGDFVFYDNKLLLVSNTRSFSIDTSDASSTLDSFHYIDFVTAATLDQNGQLLIATKNQNVTGNINSTGLWRLNPETGEKVSVGLFPSRISAMATNTQETYKCYDETVFPSETIVEVTGVTGDTVTEGQSATFNVNFDKELKASKEVTLALKDGTAFSGTDYSRDVSVIFDETNSVDVTLTDTGVKVTVPPGVSSIRVVVSTIDDNTDEDDKTFSLDAWINDDQSDKASALATIKDNDEPLGACSSGVKLQMAASGDGAWSYFGVDCNKSDVYFNAAGLYSDSARHTRVSWTTDYGSFSTTNYDRNNGGIRGYVGVTEIKTLKTLTVNGSSTIKPACQHGDVRGTPLSYVYTGSITIKADGTQQCYLKLNYDFCDGADNRVSSSATSSNCGQ
ncbi:hypothetical protein A1OQ_16630 [Enterovibrio norvegicus FF-162]|uniref:hypothetical protein n=1 Tax=Enterovibrio norvegicus TaxID=188144 RepID=UPI00031F46FB|nr:hypothetical protein [Enterovibrio norvegicus]OEE86517.1 hypothetical protein A1OQ_16630 [Enterovibrio norvegicus FF-162]